MSEPPIQIVGKVIGAEAVQARFIAATQKSRVRLLEAVNAAAMDVQTKAVTEKLKGQVLNVRTGRLWRSINIKTTAGEDAMSASVGTNVVYGRFWERGFSGTVNVKEHTQLVRFATKDGRMMTQADLIYGPATVFQTHALVFAKKRAKNQSQARMTVKAHTRSLNVAARPFLKPSLDESRDKIRGRLAAAIGSI